MSWTKRQFVEAALSSLGLAAYVFDIGPDQLQDIAKKLDAMMVFWNGKGIRLGYPAASDPDNVELDTATNVPDSANEAIYQNLALRIASGFGKVPSSELKAQAQLGFNTLLGRACQPREVRRSRTITGAGNKNLNRPFTQQTPEDIDAGPDGTLDF